MHSNFSVKFFLEIKIFEKILKCEKFLDFEITEEICLFKCVTNFDGFYKDIYYDKEKSYRIYFYEFYESEDFEFNENEKSFKVKLIIIFLVLYELNCKL